MATRQVTCYVAVCDLCGGTEDADEFTPHLDSPAEAVDHITGYGTTVGGWTLTPDGLLVCDNTEDPDHVSAHTEAGKRTPPSNADTVKLLNSAV